MRTRHQGECERSDENGDSSGAHGKTGRQSRKHGAGNDDTDRCINAAWVGSFCQRNGGQKLHWQKHLCRRAVPVRGQQGPWCRLLQHKCVANAAEEHQSEHTHFFQDPTSASACSGRVRSLGAPGWICSGRAADRLSCLSYDQGMFGIPPTSANSQYYTPQCDRTQQKKEHRHRPA